MSVTITYDPIANAAYVRLSATAPGEVRRTSEVLPSGVLLDFDKEDRLVGIEILNANAILTRETIQTAVRPSLN